MSYTNEGEGRYQGIDRWIPGNKYMKTVIIIGQPDVILSNEKLK